MGLDVHDVGGYVSWSPPRILEKGFKSLRTARYLEEGMCLSNEPGIYFIKFLLEKGFKDEKIGKYFNQAVIRSYYGFGGCRIEDIIQVTSDGCINLTKKIPRRSNDIEAYIQKNSTEK